MDKKDYSLEILLDQALKYHDKSEREEWLHKELGDKPEKLLELKELIDHHEAGKWMDQAPKAVVASLKLIEDITGKQIGPFVIIKKIGEGGMGDVYLAQQHQPMRRQIALKLIQWESEPNQIIERFQREKQMLASMEHPNIARIIDAGTTESGYSYIVMEYVKGSHLVDYCEQESPDIRSRVKLLLQCCRAIQHAHQKGIIHRDIKPNNVMVTQVDGEPTIKIIDFGIAKASMSDSIKQTNEYTSSVVSLLTNSITYRGNSPGTPPYMSPEQYSNRSSDIDTRSDIYSLGAVLYFLLTDQHPFNESELLDRDLEEIGTLVSKMDPPLPSIRSPRLAKSLRGDLDSMVRKAMCRDVEKRYQSVAQFADDLQRYLRGDSVSANPDSAWTHFRRLTKRYQLLITATALAFTTAFIAIFMAWVFAESQKTIAIRANDKEKQSSTVANLLAASSALQRREDELAIQTLEAIPAASSRLDTRLLRSQIPQRPSQFARVDGKIYYATAVDSLSAIVCGTNKSRLVAFEQNTRDRLFEIDTAQKEINGLAVSPDGKSIATAGDDGTVKFWDLDTKTLLAQIAVSANPVFQVGWGADGQSFLTAASEPNAKVWSYPQCQLIREIDSLDSRLECLATSNNNLFAFGDRKGYVRLGNLQNLDSSDLNAQSENPRSYFFKNFVCSCMSFSATGEMVAIGLNTGYLILGRIERGELIPVEQIKFPSDVTAVAFSKDEKQLAIGESSGDLHILRMKESIVGNSRLVFTKRFFEHRSEYFEGSEDPMKKLREMIDSIDPPEALEELPYDCDKVVLEFKESPKLFFYSTEFMREWRDSSGDPKRVQTELPIDVVPKGKSVELRFRNRSNLWSNPDTLRLDERLETRDGHTKRISGIAWGKNNNQVFSFSEDSTVAKLDVSTFRHDVLLSNAEHLCALTSDQIFLANSSAQSFRSVDTRNSDLLLSKIESLNLDNSPTALEHYDRNSIFLSYLNSEDDAKPRWKVDRWQRGTERERQVVAFPDNLWLANVISQLSPSQWLGKFIDWNDESNVSTKPSFLGLWDQAKNDFVWKHEPSTSAFRYHNIRPDRRCLVYENDSNVYQIDLRTGEEKLFLEKPGASVSWMKFSPDGQTLAIALNKELVINGYSSQTGELKWKIYLHGGPIKQFCWSRDQSILVTLCMDRFLRTYDVALGRITTQLPLPIDEPSELEIPSDEQSIFVLDKKGKVVRIPCPL
jgi:serine/threonine protein kinase